MNARLIAIMLMMVALAACNKDDGEEPPVITPPEPQAEPAVMKVIQQNKVKYTFSAVTPGTNVSWDFGDGQTDTRKKLDHVFPKGGTYEVVLKLTDNDGVEREAKETINVEADNAYVLGHSWQIESGTKDGEPYSEANGAAYTFYANGDGRAGESIEMPWQFNEDETAIILWPGLEYEVRWNITELTMWGMEIYFTSSKGEDYTYKFEQL